MVETKNNRNYITDIMKGIGIVLVMIGHQDLPISHFIYSFHMPLFFIISGYFYKERSVLLSIKNDFKRLVIPYIFASCLFVANELLVSIIKKDSSYIINAVIATIYGSGQSYNTALFAEIPSIGAIWFLLALFWCKNIFNLLHMICSINKLYLLCLLLSICTSFIDKHIINLPFDILPGLSAVIFYLIGFIAKRMYIRWYIVFLCILLWIIAIKYSHLYMVRSDYGNYIIDVCGAFGGTIIVYYISKFIYINFHHSSYVLIWLGVNSLPILCFHSFRINNNIWNLIGIHNEGLVILIKITIPIILTLCSCYLLPVKRILKIQTLHYVHK